MESYFRHIGIMLCSKYAKTDKREELIYLAVNMHWEGHELALPRPSKGTCWEEVFSTDAGEKLIKGGRSSQDEELLRYVPPRSIAVYVSVPVKEQALGQGRRKRQDVKEKSM